MDPGSVEARNEDELMAEIVNLKRARKKKARAEKEKKAAANRVAFGRTREEKQKSDAERALEAARHLGHRRDEDQASD